MKNALVLFVFTLPHFLQTSPPRCRKRPELGPKSSSSWLSEASLHPSCRHLGSNLAAKLGQLGTFFVSRGWPRRPLSDFASQGRPQGLPDTRFFRFRAPFLTIVWFISEVCFCKFAFLFRSFSEHSLNDLLLDRSARMAPMEGDGGTHRR